MIRSSFLLAGGLSVAMLSTLASAQDSLASLPPAVRAAAEKRFADAKIRHVSSENENGGREYEIDAITSSGNQISVTFSPEGEIMVDEQRVDLDQLPQAVRDALGKRYPDAQRVHADLAVERVYEVVIEINGKRREVVVTPNGVFRGKPGAAEGEQEGEEGAKGSESKARGKADDDDDEQGEESNERGEHGEHHRGKAVDDEEGEESNERGERDEHHRGKAVDDDEEGEESNERGERGGRSSARRDRSARVVLL